MSIIVIEGSNGAGKTTVIKNMQIRYNFVSSKSVPDWYRKYIPFARNLAPELQKQVYIIIIIKVFNFRDFITIFYKV